MIAFIFHFADGEQFEVHVCRELVNFISDMYCFDCRKFVCGRIFEIHNTNPIKQNTERMVFNCKLYQRTNDDKNL